MELKENTTLTLENTILDTGKEMHNVEITEEEKKLLKKCESEMKKLWNSVDFKMDFEKYYKFYLYRLNNKVNDPNIKHQLKDYFYEYLSSVLYQGFYLGTEFVTSVDIQVKDAYFMQPDGVILQQIPEQLEAATNGLTEKLTDISTAQFEKWILKDNPNIQGILNQIKKEIGCLGAYYAFKVERINRGIEIRKPAKYGMLYRADDLYFLNPELFAVCVLASNKAEIWEIHTWNSVKSRDSKMGEIQILKFDVEETEYAYSNFVMYEGVENVQSIYDIVQIKVKLNEFVPDIEIYPLQVAVVEAVSGNTNTMYENINISLTIYSSDTSFQYNPHQDN